MAVDQIPLAGGTCTCGCCGTEQQTPPTVAAEEPEPETTGCTCGEGASGCNCSGGADCNCGADRVA